MTGNSTVGTDGDRGAAVEDHHRTKGLLRLTMACNERCSFCNVPAEEHRDPPPDEAAIARELSSFVAAGQRTVTISGGEPTLRRRQLVRVVEGARARGIDFVELQTNAVLLDDAYTAELVAAGLTSAFVPLLAHEPPTHDELMGRTGAFDECLRGLDSLVRAGVRVTLNVVMTTKTQLAVPSVVDFVADRVPAVRSISLSAVQPHGRAAAELALLPDYAVLGPAVREAQQRAKSHRIELLNPYCGLPICVGWEDDQERCVEAIEAMDLRGAGFGDVPGIDNRGDKAQGEPCRRCALRTRCGGAWLAYWSVHGGRGLSPPEPRIEPWQPQADHAAGQRVIVQQGMLHEATLRRLKAITTPTVWLQTEHVGTGDAQRLAAAGCTDLAVRTSPAVFLASSDTHQELRGIGERNRRVADQAALCTVLLLEGRSTFRERFRAVELAAGLGLDAVRISAPGAARERFGRFVAAVRRELPELDLAAVDEESAE